MAWDEKLDGNQQHAELQNPNNAAAQQLLEDQALNDAAVNGHGLANVAANGHGPANDAVNGHGPANVAANGHGPINIAVNGHGPANVAVNGHGRANVAVNGHGPVNIAVNGHGPANLAANGHAPNIRHNERGQGHGRGDEGQAHGRGEEQQVHGRGDEGQAHRRGGGGQAHGRGDEEHAHGRGDEGQAHRRGGGGQAHGRGDEEQAHGRGDEGQAHGRGDEEQAHGRGDEGQVQGRRNEGQAHGRRDEGQAHGRRDGGHAQGRRDGGQAHGRRDGQAHGREDGQAHGRGDEPQADRRVAERMPINRWPGERAPANARGAGRRPYVGRGGRQEQAFEARFLGPPLIAPPRPMLPHPFEQAPMNGPFRQPILEDVPFGFPPLDIANMGARHREMLRIIVEYWQELRQYVFQRQVPVAQVPPVHMNMALVGEAQRQMNMNQNGHAQLNGNPLGQGPIYINYNQPPPVNMNPNRPGLNVMAPHMQARINAGAQAWDHFNMAPNAQHQNMGPYAQRDMNLPPFWHQPENMNRHWYPPADMANAWQPPRYPFPNGHLPGNMYPDRQVPVHMAAGGHLPANMEHGWYQLPPEMMGPAGHMAPPWQQPLNMGPEEAFRVHGWQPPEHMFPGEQLPVDMVPNGQPIEDMAPIAYLVIDERPPENMVPDGQLPEHRIPDGQIPADRAVAAQPPAIRHHDERQPDLIWVAGFAHPLNGVPGGRPPENGLAAGQLQLPENIALNRRRRSLRIAGDWYRRVDHDHFAQAPANAVPEEQAPAENMAHERQPEDNNVPGGQPEDINVPEGHPADEVDHVHRPAGDDAEEVAVDDEDDVPIPMEIMPQDEARYPEPIPHPDSPSFQRLVVEIVPVVRRCTADRGACHCATCKFLYEMPMELLIQTFDYLNLMQLISAKIAFAGYGRVQKALGASWKFYHRLDVSIFDEIRPMPPGYLDDVVASMPYLEQLLCSTNRKRLRNSISPSVLYEHCPYLWELDLSIIRFEETSMAEVCRRYPRLARVRMPAEYSEEDMATLLAGLPRLRDLESGSGAEEGGTFGQLPPTLQRLTLTRCGSLRSWNLRLVARCTQLRELLLYARVGEAQLTYGYRERFRPFDDSLTDSQLSLDDWTAIMAACPNLERLALAGGFRLTRTHLTQLTPERCGRLEELDLSRVQGMTSSGLSFLDLIIAMVGCPRLKLLTLQAVQDLPLLTSALPAAVGLEITYLDVSGSLLSDIFLMELRDLMPFLRILLMRECPGISGGAMYFYVACLTLLEELDIRGASGATDVALQKLQYCTRLTTLWLRPGPGQCSIVAIENAVYNIESLETLHVDLRRSGQSVATLVVDFGMMLREMPSKRKLIVTMHADYLAHMEKPPPTGVPRLSLLHEPFRYPGYDSDSTGSPTGSVEDLQHDEPADLRVVRQDGDE